MLPLPCPSCISDLDAFNYLHQHHCTHTLAHALRPTWPKAMDEIEELGHCTFTLTMWYVEGKQHLFVIGMHVYIPTDHQTHVH